MALWRVLGNIALAFGRRGEQGFDASFSKSFHIALYGRGRKAEGPNDIGLRNKPLFDPLSGDEPKALHIGFVMSKNWKMTIEIGHLILAAFITDLGSEILCTGRKNGKLHLGHAKSWNYQPKQRKKIDHRSSIARRSQSGRSGVLSPGLRGTSYPGLEER